MFKTDLSIVLMNIKILIYLRLKFDFLHNV